MIPPVYAQVDFSNKQKFVFAKFDSIATIVNIMTPLFMIVGGFMCLGMLLFGAFQYLTAGDSAEKVKKAQATLMYAVLGLIIMVSSYTLVKIIAFVFKVQDKIPL